MAAASVFGFVCGCLGADPDTREMMSMGETINGKLGTARGMSVLIRVVRIAEVAWSAGGRSLEVHKKNRHQSEQKKLIPRIGEIKAPYPSIYIYI